MKQLVRKGSPSKTPRTKYVFRQKRSLLSTDQIKSVNRLVDDLISSLQLLVDDRIEEDPVLRRLLLEEFEKEHGLARSLILLTLKKKINQIASI